MIDRLIDELNSCFLFSFHFLEQLWSRVQYYPPKQFNEWNRMISTFIWEKQKLRIRYQTLQLPKDKGGRTLPCLEDYYRAAQLRFQVGWCDLECEAKWKSCLCWEIPLEKVPTGRQTK